VFCITFLLICWRMPAYAHSQARPTHLPVCIIHGVPRWTNHNRVVPCIHVRVLAIVQLIKIVIFTCNFSISLTWSQRWRHYGHVKLWWHKILYTAVGLCISFITCVFRFHFSGLGLSDVMWKGPRVYNWLVTALFVRRPSSQSGSVFLALVFISGSSWADWLVSS